MEDLDKIVAQILHKDANLRQLATWLENSERYTKYNGENVYHMIFGIIFFLSDHIPDIDMGAHASTYIIYQLQQQSGLDLGLCQYYKSSLEPKDVGLHGIAVECKASNGPEIAHSTHCLAPLRGQCPFRNSNQSDGS